MAYFRRRHTLLFAALMFIGSGISTAGAQTPGSLQIGPSPTPTSIPTLAPTPASTYSEFPNNTFNQTYDGWSVTWDNSWKPKDYPPDLESELGPVREGLELRSQYFDVFIRAYDYSPGFGPSDTANCNDYMANFYQSKLNLTPLPGTDGSPLQGTSGKFFWAVYMAQVDPSSPAPAVYGGSSSAVQSFTYYARMAPLKRGNVLCAAAIGPMKAEEFNQHSAELEKLVNTITVSD